MALSRHIKETPVFGSSCKNFYYWKKCMIKYINILDVWSIVEHGYEPKYNTTTHSLTTESQIDKGLNDYAVNVILNSVSEPITLVFGNMTNARDMWLALLNRFEGNTQIKRTKIMGLETKFENFKIEDHESIEELYNRLLSIQNEFQIWVSL
jgi:gag-polypeptide of LTR copia-type